MKAWGLQHTTYELMLPTARMIVPPSATVQQQTWLIISDRSGALAFTSDEARAASMAAAEAIEAAPESSEGGGHACHPFGSSSSSVFGSSATSMPANSVPEAWTASAAFGACAEHSHGGNIPVQALNTCG